jgi:hypothetical protein
MQLIRRVIRTRSPADAAPDPAPAVSRDWIEGGVSERHARTRFDLVLRALATVEGTKHDGWQPVVARSTGEVSPWPSR